MLYLAERLNYLSKEKSIVLIYAITEISKIITGLIKSITKS